jgi:hypothetical protein
MVIAAIIQITSSLRLPLTSAHVEIGATRPEGGRLGPAIRSEGQGYMCQQPSAYQIGNRVGVSTNDIGAINHCLGQPVVIAL